MRRDPRAPCFASYGEFLKARARKRATREKQQRDERRRNGCCIQCGTPTATGARCKDCRWRQKLARSR